MTLAGWAEILFIAILAFVIIGPKDLPKVLFAIGRFVQTLRRLSNEFMTEFEAINHVKEVEDKKKKKNSDSDIDNIARERIKDFNRSKAISHEDMLKMFDKN